MHLQKETHPMACQTTKIQQKNKSMDVKNYSSRTMFLKPRKRKVSKTCSYSHQENRNGLVDVELD